MAAAIAPNYPSGLIGETIEGRYRIESVLAQGGMGTVFRATHLTLNRSVALKILRPDLESDQTQRFLREANIVAQLEHRNCVAVFDHGRARNGLHFMAMQLLKGHTLSRDTGVAMEPVAACRIIADVLRGLEHAHSRNVVHRDLKPENLFVTQDEEGRDCIKILDFGIAKFKALDPSQEEAVTLSGLMAGTPAYMSPEQVIGADTDERTDLYATGVILYELLAGKIPFETDDPVVLLHHQLNEEFPPLPDAVPEVLQAVVRKLCDKERSKRFASATDALAEIEAYLVDTVGEEATGSASSLRRLRRSTDDGGLALVGGRDTITDAAVLEERRSEGRPWWQWGVAAGLVLVAGGIAVPMLQGSDGSQTTAASVAEIVDPAEEPGDAEVPAPSAEDDHGGLLSLLAKVNDPEHPLPFDARHQSLDELRNSDYAAKVDSRLQLGLDLLQASESPTPCRTFREAITQIRDLEDAYFVSYVRSAEVPEPGDHEQPADCEGLTSIVGATSQAFGDQEAEPTVARAAAATVRSSKRRSARKKHVEEGDEEVVVPEAAPAPAPTKTAANDRKPLPKIGEQSASPAPARASDAPITKLQNGRLRDL